jgi:uncharacterized membrane protein YeiB
MSHASYRILDEPVARGFTLPALNPFWPLLGMMFGGAWLGVAMFVFNAVALRGPTFARELGIAGGILLGSPLIVFLIGFALNQQWMTEGAIKYALLLVVAWKLSLAYWVFFLQQQSHALYEYFERGSRNPQLASVGPALVIAGSLVKSSVIGAVDSPFWTLMVN